MKTLWAPWRMQFVEQLESSACIFCELPKKNKDSDNMILFRGSHAFVLMNIFPYNSAHIMVAPFHHTSSLSGISDETLHSLSRLTRESVRIVEEAFHPDGVNVGMNIGKAAGAGFDEHIHMHIVPRWIGDTNFMPVIGETKVLPEFLRETYQKMLPLFKEIDA